MDSNLPTNESLAKTTKKDEEILTKPEKTDKKKKDASKRDKYGIKNPLWLPAAQSAMLLGVQKRTIKRAIKSNHVLYKIEHNKYLIEVGSLINYAHSTKRLENKLYNEGFGQYIKKWDSIVKKIRQGL